MDDIKKKRTEKTLKVIDGVADNFSKAMKQRELVKLYDRKLELLDIINNEELDNLAKRNKILQLKQVNESIRTLELTVDLSTNYDTEVDEKAAKEFIKDNPDVFLDNDQLIKSNDALDELENSLKKK